MILHAMLTLLMPAARLLLRAATDVAYAMPYAMIAAAAMSRCFDIFTLFDAVTRFSRRHYAYDDAAACLMLRRRRFACLYAAPRCHFAYARYLYCDDMRAMARYARAQRRRV